MSAVTEREAEAMRVLREAGQKTDEIARALGRNRKTVERHLDHPGVTVDAQMVTRRKRPAYSARKGTCCSVCLAAIPTGTTILWERDGGRAGDGGRAVCPRCDELEASPETAAEVAKQMEEFRVQLGQMWAALCQLQGEIREVERQVSEHAVAEDVPAPPKPTWWRRA